MCVNAPVGIWTAFYWISHLGVHPFCFAAPPGVRCGLTAQIWEFYWIDRQRRGRTGVTPQHTGQRKRGEIKAGPRPSWQGSNMALGMCACKQTVPSQCAWTHVWMECRVEIFTFNSSQWKCTSTLKVTIHSHILTVPCRLDMGWKRKKDTSVFSLFFCLSLCELLPSSLSASSYVSPVRSSLIRNSSLVCACVCLCECVYEFCSTGMMHLVYPISLKTISLLFSLSICIWLYNTTGHNTTQHSFNCSRLCSQSVYRLVLCSCGPV